MPGNHAKLAPSASKRWMNCTASPLYVAALIDAGTIVADQSSKYAEEGTEAHDWASKLLLGQVKPSGIPEDFRPHIVEYARVCAECDYKAGPRSVRMVEQKVPLFYSPEETGTMDYGIVRVLKCGTVEGIHIRDLKYGAGVPVDAEENTQLAIYAMSWILDLEDWWAPIPDHVPVSIGIHQPRYRGDDSLKVWETTVGDLRDFCSPIRLTAMCIKEAGEGDQECKDALEFKPSADVCQFCPAKGVCKARLEATFEQFPGDVISLDLMSNLDLPDLETVPLETVVAIWRHRKDIGKYLENAGEFLTALALAGNPAPGTKLVGGRDGNRDWKDELEAEKVLKPYVPENELWTRTLISPAKAEVHLKPAIGKPAMEAKMLKLVTRAAGKTVLAEAEDKREEVRPAVSQFTMITDEEEND